MINKLKNIIKIIIWPIIFIVGQIFVIFIFSLPFRIKNGSLVNFEVLLSNYINSNNFLISIITFIIFLPLFMKEYNKYKEKDSLKLKLKNIIFYILLGGSINLSFNIIIFYFNQIFLFTSNYNVYNTSILVSLVLTGILGPILEEYLFRGICYNQLKKIFSSNVSLFLSCL